MMTTVREHVYEVDIRGMKLPKDLPAVMDIERRVKLGGRQGRPPLEEFWNEDRFQNLKKEKALRLVFEIDKMIVAYAVYGPDNDLAHLFIHNMCVHPEWTGIGVGTLVVNELTSKLKHQRRETISIEVNTDNLSLRKFLHNRGFEGCPYDTDTWLYMRRKNASNTS